MNTKFEYYSNCFSLGDVTEMSNTMGARGWELVTANAFKDQFGATLVFMIFKRAYTE